MRPRAAVGQPSSTQARILLLRQEFHRPISRSPADAEVPSKRVCAASVARTAGSSSLRAPPRPPPAPEVDFAAWMPFPISLAGVVAVSGLTVDETIARLERALAGAGATALRRESNGLQFGGTAFRLVSNWNVLVPISTGIIEVRSRNDGIIVWYRLRFTWVLVAVTLLVTGLFAPIAVASNAPMAGRLIFPVVGWLWLFGGNFVLTRWRFPRFLTRSLLHAAESGKAR